MKKKRKKMPPKKKGANRYPLIEKAIRKHTKGDLIEMVIRIAKNQPELTRTLEAEFNVQKPVDLLVADISSAIDRATEIDEHMINHNFDVDWQAYEDVQNGLQQLIELEQLDHAKILAHKLMKEGSYQVECSDEGLMTDDIQECLIPVIRAVKSADGKTTNQWASDMIQADRVGFICENELNAILAKS